VSPARLAEDVRAELAAIAPSRRCDRLAEVSALFHTAGAIHLRGRREIAFHLDLPSNGAARRAFSLLRTLRIDAEIRTYRRRAFDCPVRYQLHIEGDDRTVDTLAEAGVIDRADRTPLRRPPGHVVSRGCCRGAYLRGAFLGGGSLTGPRSPHLEIRTPTHAGAAFVRAVAHTEGVALRVMDKASHSLAYAKSWDAIEGFLAAAGATESVLALEERAVVAELRGQANRLANADTANLVRQSRAAELHLAAIGRLRTDGKLESLPDALREAAELRARYPSLALRELASKAEPPATKAGIQRRLARLVELADEQQPVSRQSL
jgi:hypothetical protein